MHPLKRECDLERLAIGIIFIKTETETEIAGRKASCYETRDKDMFSNTDLKPNQIAIKIEDQTPAGFDIEICIKDKDWRTYARFVSLAQAKKRLWQMLNKYTLEDIERFIRLREQGVEDDVVRTNHFYLKDAGGWKGYGPKAFKTFSPDELTYGQIAIILRPSPYLNKYNIYVKTKESSQRLPWRIYAGRLTEERGLEILKEMLNERSVSQIAEHLEATTGDDIGNIPDFHRKEGE